MHSSACPHPPHNLKTLVDVSRWRADHRPDDLAFTFLLDGETDEVSFDYAALDARARSIAAELHSRHALGERVLLAQAPGLEYVASILGCMYAGAIAVPVYPPDPYRLSRTLPRLQAIVKSAEAEFLISSREFLGDGGKHTALWDICSNGTICIEDVARDQTCDPVKHDEHGVALLQFTSGSTGSPRGVALTHANLMHNFVAMHEAFDIEDAVGVQWLPPYHDMGLIGGILLPLYSGRRTVMMSPLSFMQRPLRWLMAFDRFRGTTTGSPNFGYELCIRKIKPEECDGLDLSSWKIAITGAEPVRLSTMERFVDKFSPYGFERETFTPAYGMAEATVIVTGKRYATLPESPRFSSKALEANRVELVGDEAQDARPVVSCGIPMHEIDVVVVDPQSRKRLPAGQVGEVWVHSPGVAPGYWGMPHESAEVFDVKLDGHDDTGYLRTGDLGFLHEGQLYVTGRRKELIIIGGRNFYPHDVEAVVQESHPGLKLDGGASFAIDSDHGEQLVIVQEVSRPRQWDMDQIVRCVRAALTEQLGLAPSAIVLIPNGSLPKTSSGKSRRRSCRDDFLAGRMRSLHSWIGDDTLKEVTATDRMEPRAGMETEVAKLWIEVLGIDSVAREDSFFDLGGQSLLVMQLLGRVRETFQVDPTLQILFENPTLHQFAAAISKLQLESSPEDSGNSLAAIVPVVDADESKIGPQPLSYSQQRFWFLQQMGESGAFLHVPFTVRLTGQLNLRKLQVAVDRLVDRHEILRTGFFDEEGQPFQQIIDCECVPLEKTDLSDLAAADQVPRLDSIKHELARRPFDMRKPPLMRAALVRISPAEHILVVVFHHITCDAWSLEILLRDLAAYYRSETSESVDGRLRYVDFARWQNEHPDLIESQVGYWKDRLAAAPTVLDLPTDYPRTTQPVEEVAVSRCTIPHLVRRAIEKLALSRTATPFMLYLAAYQSLLARYAGCEDLCVGVPTANRNRPELEPLAGCFINTLVSRGNLAGDPAFLDLIDRTKDSLLADLQHADAPFEKIVEALQPEREPGRMPLVQAMFLLQNPLALPDHMDDVQIADVEPDYSGLAAFDLTLVVEIAETDSNLSIVYDPNLFDAATIGRMLDSFVAILERVVAAPSTRLSELPIPSTDEQRTLTIEWNQTEQPGSEFQTVQELVAVQVRQRPNDVAIRTSDTKLTYLELEDRSNQLANALRERGIQDGDRVGIYMLRSPDVVVTMLAAWKAGAIYVPLDPSYPESRVKIMASDSALSLIIAEEPLLDRLPSLDADIISFEELRESLATQSTIAPQTRCDADSLAYVIYTSGSTGAPKGVMVSHGNVVNFLSSFAREPGLVAGETLLAHTTISFDISVLELFLPLSVGACIALPGSAEAADGDRLKKFIDANSIDMIQATPSGFRMLLLAGWQPSATMKIVCGGEPLTADLARKLLRPGCRLWNVYGPTETTVWSTIHRVAESTGPIPIGRPIDNTQVYVLDSQSHPVPIGVPGELFIGGRGVSAGYWKRKDLTEERFIDDPFRGEGRLYRTGDIVRWRIDGTLEYLSRADHQVKVRGFRVELGEIESVLAMHDGLVESVVNAPETDGVHQSLVAYYQPDEDHQLSPGDLRQFIAQRLPEYMVPTLFVELCSIPKTPAGKIDRAGLPVPDDAIRTSHKYVAPRTPLEKEIVSLWSEVLRRPRIGIHDNFFELGGHSLIAAQLFTRLRDHVQVDLPLRQLYERPTVADLAEFIVAAQVEQSNERKMLELMNQIESISDEEAIEALRLANHENA